MTQTVDGRARATRPPVPRLVPLTGALAVFILLCGLGIWQVQRLAWKTGLIATVEARLAAAPVPAPGPDAWPELTQAEAEYRRVTVSGRYRPESDRLVKAVTARGPGFWVMTPLDTDRGWQLLINRGFVPDSERRPQDRDLPANDVTISGLLRMSQPGGGFLRANDAAANRWYSRDVAAIAAARGLGRTAPYFVDADAAPNPGGLPVGGLTVVKFPDNHLVYALTWFALMLLALFFAWRLWRPGADASNMPDE